MADELPISAETCEAQALNAQADPFRFQKFNTAQRRFLRAIKNPKKESLTIILFLKPNRVGGSRALVAAWSLIIFGTAREAAQCSPFGDRWPFPVRNARLISTAETLGDVGPLQKAVRDLFPLGRYTQSRGVGKAYNSAGKADNGWTWDIMSSGQDALAAAGSTMGLILASEPLGKDLFTECLTRLGGNGMFLLECTQLDLAPYLEEMAEDAGGTMIDGIQYGHLKLDGKNVGEIRIVRGDIEESCKEHHNGHQSHSAIEATIAGWPVEEREARKTGKPLKLSGRIFPTWGDVNELTEVPEWHRKEWDAGNVVISCLLDPHDRKPWALGWFATYPNDDVIAFQEWPPFDFESCKTSPVTEIDDYRAIILGLDAAVDQDIDNRVIDKLFGNTPGKGTALTLKKMLSRPCRACMRHVGRSEYEDLDERSTAYLEAERACKHRLVFSDGVAYAGSINDGHILVRNALGGGPEGHRPKLYAMKEYCPNFCKAFRRYAWKENKSHLSEKASLVYKDMIDLVTNFYRKGLNVYPRDPSRLPRVKLGRTWKPRAEALPITPTQTPRDGRPKRK